MPLDNAVLNGRALSLIPDSGKSESGMGTGMIPRADPRQNASGCEPAARARARTSKGSLRVRAVWVVPSLKLPVLP
jgi:hypothetical protein